MTWHLLGGFHLAVPGAVQNAEDIRDLQHRRTQEDSIQWQEQAVRLPG